MLVYINKVKFEIKDDKIIINNEELDLQPKEFTCLKLCLESDNKILFKAELMDKIWNNIVVTDDSLFKIVQEIRKIFRQYGLPDETLINVYGKGYQIKPQITKTITKQFNFLSPFVFLLVAASIILLLIILKYPYATNTNLLTDEKYEQLVASINSKFNTQEFDLHKLRIDESSSHQDRIRFAYVNGLMYYKKGDYSNSIMHLKSVLALFEKQKPIKSMADTYLLLSAIYIYRNDMDLLKQYIHQADKIYSKLNDESGKISTAITKARYFQVLKQYPESIDLLKQVLSAAEQNQDLYNQMRVYANLAYSYEQTNQQTEHILALEKTLQLALDTSDGKYASYAYGALAIENLKKSNYVKAMSYAENTVKFVLEQNDTNIFQQGFSSFYNILNYLGHDKLAEKYLKLAINIQAKFNNESLLILAEKNLAILKIQQNKFLDSHRIFKKLLNIQLSVKNKHEIEAWMALNDVFRNDNISAYTLSKKVFNTKSINNKTKLIAGLAHVLSSYELERSDESKSTFMVVTKIANSEWLIEFSYFIDVAIFMYSDVLSDEEGLHTYIALRKSFDNKLLAIKKTTVPSTEVVLELDQYIEKIINL